MFSKVGGATVIERWMRFYWNPEVKCRSKAEWSWNETRAVEINDPRDIKIGWYTPAFFGLEQRQDRKGREWSTLGEGAKRRPRPLHKQRVRTDGLRTSLRNSLKSAKICRGRETRHGRGFCRPLLFLHCPFLAWGGCSELLVLTSYAISARHGDVADTGFVLLCIQGSSPRARAGRCVSLVPVGSSPDLIHSCPAAAALGLGLGLHSSSFPSSVCALSSYSSCWSGL